VATKNLRLVLGKSGFRRFKSACSRTIQNAGVIRDAGRITVDAREKEGLQ
jgi:hypothetical protein